MPFSNHERKQNKKLYLLGVRKEHRESPPIPEVKGELECITGKGRATTSPPPPSESITTHSSTFRTGSGDDTNQDTWAGADKIKNKIKNHPPGSHLNLLSWLISRDMNRFFVFVQETKTNLPPAWTAEKSAGWDGVRGANCSLHATAKTAQEPWLASVQGGGRKEGGGRKVGERGLSLSAELI